MSTSPFDQAFQRLSDLTNYEKSPVSRNYRFDLHKMETLLTKLGNPEKKLRCVVQVGGSKGKGTVSCMTGAIAASTGASVGVYLSPHVRDVRERILLNGEKASQEALIPHLERVAKNFIKNQTWFEAFTAVALSFFAEQNLDIVILEVGLGGRLDSTNVVPKQACCITTIEKEHTITLGDRIEDITKEKAGILRPGVPCVSGLTGLSSEVLQKMAHQIRAPLIPLSENLHCNILDRGPWGMVLTHPLLGPKPWKLPIHTETQARSLALSLLLFQQIPLGKKIQLQHQTFSTSLKLFHPPGRFQILNLDGGRTALLDGAHTNDSLAALGRDLRPIFGKPDLELPPNKRHHSSPPFDLLFAIADNKHWEEGLGSIAPFVDKAFGAPLREKQSMDPQKMAEWFEKRRIPFEAMDSVESAVKKILARTTNQGLLITGSFYGVGEALEVLEHH
jgi:dihydrofolate synthase/folylpolyglutamate synthase